MANNAPIAYQAIPITLAAGATLNLPGTFTWIEILEEYETTSTSVNSQAVQVGFYPNTTPVILPAGIEVSLEPGFPSTSLLLINTDEINSITLLVAMGAGKKPAVDHRLVFPVGSLVNVVVTNTNADPVPVAIIGGLSELAVSGEYGGNLPPAGCAYISPATAHGNTFNQSTNVSTELVSAVLNTLGVVLDLCSMWTPTTAGSYCQLESNGAVFLELGSGVAGLVIPPLFIPAGNDLKVNTNNGAICSGSFRILH